jgi:superfamily II DNA or RNA helicase
METIVVDKKNESVLSVDSDPSLLKEISEHFSFFAEGYKWMPAFRQKRWDGKIRIFDGAKKELPVGLYPHLKIFARERGYTITVKRNKFYGSPMDRNEVNPEELMDFVKSLNLASYKGPIQIRDYQFNAVCESYARMRACIQSPTASGKSLILYVLMRLMMQKTVKHKKILIIVPTTGLVDQLYDDFVEYASDSKFNVSKHVHKIYGGKEKHNIEERVVISTWQSIYKMPPRYFKDFYTVFGDEAHGFKSASCTGIMSKCKDAKFRIGTTGTIDNAHVHKLVLEGMFGKVLKMVTTKELQDNNTIAKSKINVIKLNYDMDFRESLGKMEYQRELDFIVTNDKRNEFIKKLALSLKGNTLILFQFVEKHGKVLHKMIDTDAEEGRKIFYVSGEVKTAEREAVRKLIETQKNSITCASVVFATGTNIVNLDNLILVSPSKSMIKLLQSIGRVLRKSGDGYTNIYDIIDVLHPRRSKKNYALLHGEARMKIYKSENLEFKIREIDF